MKQGSAGCGESSRFEGARLQRCRRVAVVASLALLVLLAGCRSPWIACTIVNHQPTPVSLVEVTYPGGSFGVQTIAPGASYHYRFHALGTDPTSIDFIDAAHKSHTAKGPELRLGQEGTLAIAIEPDNHAAWTTSLRNAR